MAQKQTKGNRQRTIEEYECALDKAGGFLAEASRILGVSRSAVTQRVKKSKRLQKKLQEIIEFHLDVAESKLLSCVNKEQGWAVMYYLNNKGKPRGYGRKWWEEQGAEDKAEAVEWSDPGPPERPNDEDEDFDLSRLLEDMPNRSRLTENDLGLNCKGAGGARGRQVDGKRHGQD